MRDNTGWETCLSAADLGEEGLLRQMLTLVQERDPDVIEGHNIFNFDLDYLEKRCRRYKIKLSLGRGNRPVTSRPSRFSAGERIVNYKRYAVYGRHVIDTYHLVMLYDLSHRDMDSYGLKAAAKYFGINSSDRTYVEGKDITAIYEQDPARLQAYCLDDVRETEGLSRLLSPSYFYQAQVLPLSYQNCVTRGNATRIDALLCAEYLLRNAALPSPQATRTFQGGLTEATRTGLFENVWHIDVRSLYPSIILARNFTPVSDNLALFRHILATLRDFRLAAKDAQRQAAPAEKDHWGALQNSFKILINSFYGYLGFSQGTFNDYNMAEKVTAQGREILSSMKEHLQNIGAQVIEMDTDGIYFTPPADCRSRESMEQAVQSILPQGIEVELDATYQAMYAYKSKNYALLDDAGEVHITGAALKSRGLEPFQRNYMREHLTLLLTGRQQELPALLQKYISAITEQRLPLADLAKREVLSVAPATYAEKLADGTGRRSAAYELVLASKIDYRQGDTVQFYVTGNKKNVSVSDNSKLLSDGDEQNRDENVPYYLERLQQLVDKFKPE
ncbi:MAG: DNA polymerase II [Oligosphaeraceae bacterium]|nr:DNA polymerase II [Oligosphaeraceae bacterium]